MKLAIAYKNFAAHKGISHIGLGVTALTNSKILRKEGFRTEVWPVLNNINIVDKIRESIQKNDPITHLVIQAPWLSTRDVSAMVHAFPDIKFAILSHSNVGFLQADPNGITLLKDAGKLEQGVHNFHIAGNSKKFVNWWEKTFHQKMLYLPNLYCKSAIRHTGRRWKGGVLRIGAFGAVRPLKNFLTAAAAALTIAEDLNTDLELYFSGGRFEGGGDVMWRAINALFAGLSHAKIIQLPWQSWPEFKKSVGTMHLLLQPSYTESFNMVTADGIDMGVPSVVSDAIDWAPDSWKAKGDEPLDIAKVGKRLLRNPFAIWQGRFALAWHNYFGIKSWKKFLEE